MSAKVGRPAMPDQWKRLTGQAPSGPDAPAVQFAPGAPPCPQHVERNRDAFAEWNRIVPELITAGLLCTVDAAALAMYCVAYSRWVKAEEQIQLQEQMGYEGEIKKAANGFEQLSQWYIVSSKEQDRLHKMLTEFGLSPSARARVRGMAAQGDLFGNDPLEAFKRAAPKAA